MARAHVEPSLCADARYPGPDSTGPVHITDADLRTMLEAGFTPSAIAIACRVGVTTIARRVREQRAIHGPTWGGSVSVDPSEDYQARLHTTEPTIKRTRYTARHALQWALETPGTDASRLGKLALETLQSPEYAPEAEVEETRQRRQRILEVVVRAIDPSSGE